MIVVNPIMGGGLSNAKLALADAVAANVLSGKKFYSGSKELKTGTLFLPHYKKGTIQLKSSIGTTYIDIGFSPALLFVHYYYGSGNQRTDFYRCYRPYKFQSDSYSWTIEAGESNGRLYLRNLGSLDVYAEYYVAE